MNMGIPNTYYYMLKDYKEKKRNYKDLDLEDKLFLMHLYLKLNGINVKEEKFHTKSEFKTNKKNNAERFKIKNR